MNGAVPLFKFTPSAQDPEVLEAITVQREPLIADLVEAALDTGGGIRHQLLIGARGMGKTHVLTLVASRVRVADDAEAVVLARLDEDPWAITSYAKFLGAILASVARESEDDALLAKAAELRASRAVDGGDGEQVLRDVVGHLRLVLIAENLDEIFRRIGDNGQERFRAFAEDWQQMLILASATQLFEGIQLHGSPFYGFFAITHLDELSLDNAVELMRRLAELRGDAELTEFLGTDVARRRLAAVEALAGGHPRVWQLLSGCVSIKAIDELVPLFLEALDELTPYYQDRLRELGDQQQELTMLLSEAGGALSNRDLAERSGIAQNQIATMLRHLTDRGYVRRAELPDDLATGDARMSYWELREPLMRLCLDVKRARGEPLRMVVEFLRAWYGSRLLDELAALPPSAELATTYAREAFRTLEVTLPETDLFRGSADEILARAELGLSVAPGRRDLRIALAAGLMLEENFGEARDALEAALVDDEVSDVFRLAIGLQLVIAKRALGEPVNTENLVVGLVQLRADGPDDPEAQRVAAVGLQELRCYEEAVSGLPKAIELNPNDALLYGAYGRTLGELGRGKEAVDAFTKAIEIDPGDALLHANRGIALRRIGRYEEAIEGLVKAMEIDPNNHTYSRCHVVALEEAGREEEALAALDRYVEVAPDDATGHSRRGGVLRDLGRGDEALAAFERAIELDPDDAIYHEQLGMTLASLERLDEALTALHLAIELDPDSPEIHSNLGVIFAAAGRYEDAVTASERALDLDPDDPDLHNNRGAALLALDRNEEAFLALRRASELAPEDLVVQLNLGAVLGVMGRHEEALVAFERGAKLDPEDYAPLEGRARALRALGRDDEALAVVRQASEADPSNPRILNQEANLLREIALLDEAEVAVRQAIELDQQELVYRFTLCEISIAGGRIDAALEQLREALALWTRQEEIAAGDTDLLCQIVWGSVREQPAREKLIKGIVSAYDEVGAADVLSQGLVSSIAFMAASETSVEAADSWAQDWLGAGKGVEDLEIPLRLVSAASAWKKDRDRSHLLDLPPEQREILVGLLTPGE